METKEQLVNNIKEWIKIDKEVLQLKQETKQRIIKQKALTNMLLDVMKTNKIDCFDINGGSLVYKQNKIKKPINTSTLMTALQTYFSNDTTHDVDDIAKHILNSREEKITEVIRRKQDK